MRKPKVLTWHVHGSYLYYLTQTDCEFYLPKGEGEGYGGRTGSFFWGDNVHEVPVAEIPLLDFDGIVFQSRKNYEEDQYRILSDRQRELPKIYIEHDPPREHPTDTKHVVDDPNMLLVHVTHFNNLMADNNRTPTKVIEHGVMVPPEVSYSGELERGIVVVNNLQKRGRRLGHDVFEQVRQAVPLDLVGMGASDLGGIGEIPYNQLHDFNARYRFFFNPIRYTSFGLAVCEAMMSGLPIVGLATTEMARNIQNGVTGYTDTNVEQLIPQMQRLLQDHKHAKTLSRNAQEFAQERFGIERFRKEWLQTICDVMA